MSWRGLCLVWDSRTVWIDVVSPTVQSDSTDFAAVRSCLDLGKPIVERQRIIRDILATAVVSGEFDGRDGAYSNKKYEAARQEYPDLFGILHLPYSGSSRPHAATRGLEVSTDPPSMQSLLF